MALVRTFKLATPLMCHCLYTVLATVFILLLILNYNKMEYKRCYDCKFWATQDTGYSNYTVLETEVHCLKKHFEPVEESYSWTYGGKNPENDHEFFRQAEKCDDYKKGDGICLDVDGDTTIEDYKEDTELYDAAVEYGW